MKLGKCEVQLHAGAQWMPAHAVFNSDGDPIVFIVPHESGPVPFTVEQVFNHRVKAKV